jgi:hypothetical protein
MLGVLSKKKKKRGSEKKTTRSRYVRQGGGKGEGKQIENAWAILPHPAKANLCLGVLPLARLGPSSISHSSVK